MATLDWLPSCRCQYLAGLNTTRNCHFLICILNRIFISRAMFDNSLSTFVNWFIYSGHKFIDWYQCLAPSIFYALVSTLFLVWEFWRIIKYAKWITKHIFNMNPWQGVSLSPWVPEEWVPLTMQYCKNKCCILKWLLSHIAEVLQPEEGLFQNLLLNWQKSELWKANILRGENMSMILCFCRGLLTVLSGTSLGLASC